MKRVMVDMSATIIHHGHIRIIQKAAKYGTVVVGLTTDDQISVHKGYDPEIPFAYRQEILEAIQGVEEVVPTPWVITDEVLDQYDIDLLVHGHDNSNTVNSERLLVVPRTEGICSMAIRQMAIRSVAAVNNKKLMLTPGPAVLLHENLKHLGPMFGRGDEEYQKIAQEVLNWIKDLAGQDEVVLAQGSATFALELAAHTFVSGNVLLITTGYYSERLEKLLPSRCSVTKADYCGLDDIKGTYDWVLCAYTETSRAFKLDLQLVKGKANSLGALLYVDATGSIGLEDHHGLGDVIAFSSCKGLLGLTGAAFICHKANLRKWTPDHFYFNCQTHENRLVTGPYHAIASLYGVIPHHGTFKKRISRSKQHVLEQFASLIPSDTNQPLLCTYIAGRVIPKDDNIVLYSPRSDQPGSVVCHLGEIHHDKVALTQRIAIQEL